MDADIGWFAVYTKRRQEHAADVRLLEMGLETFLPLVMARVQRRVQVRPLFPCYLFARFDPARWLYAIDHLTGVRQVVSVDGRPLPVDETIIAELRQAGDARGVIELDQRPRPGDEVRIQTGLFAGLVGRVEQMRPRDRVVVLLRAIVSRARVEVDTDMVEVLRAYTPR